MSTRPVSTQEAEQVTITPPDGTPIAVQKRGAGPPLVLVHGTTGNHLSFRFVEPLLGKHFTVYAIDRRGRGESGDAPEYAIEREFEDLAAVVDSLGEPANLLGHSYGASCALGAAPLARNLRKLVLYEPAPGLPVVPTSTIERIEEMIQRGECDQAIAWMFRDVLELSEDEVEQVRALPTWPMRVAAADTVPREFRAEAGYRPDPEQFRSVTAPALLMLGSQSPEWAHQGIEVARSVLLDARITVLPGQGHLAITTAPELFASEVVRFLQAAS
jgi:pimeloyl-ACP methyl ester carboxylesterase